MSVDIWVAASVVLGQGGYGLVVEYEGKTYEHSGYVERTTAEEARFQGLSEVVERMSSQRSLIIYTKCESFHILLDSLMPYYPLQGKLVGLDDKNIIRAGELANYERFKGGFGMHNLKQWIKNGAPKVELWTDGSSTGGRGPGGWAALLRFGEHEKVVVGNDDDTTNNEMEYKAVVEGLRVLQRPCRVIVHTDSELAIGGLSKGWNIEAPHLVALVEQFKRMVDKGGHLVQFVHVRGHSGIANNERVDKLAKEAKEMVE